MVSWTLILALTTPSLNLAESTARPHALIAMQKARLRLKTGRVEWREIRPKSQVSTAPRNYLCKWAGADFIHVRLGGDDGVVQMHLDGAPAADYSDSGPEHYLVKGGSVLSHVQDSVAAEIFEGQIPPMCGFDVRVLGLTSFLPSAGTHLDDIVNDFGFFEKRVVERFTEQQSGKTYEVTAEFKDGWKAVWRIDPQKGWSCVEARSVRDGREMDRSVSEIGQWNGTWFPTRVEYYMGSSLESIIDVKSADFNRPDDPQTLKASHIGVDVGMAVSYAYWPVSPEKPKPPGAWDGVKVSPTCEVSARMKSGELKRGPDTIRAIEILRYKNREKQLRALQEKAATIDAPPPPLDEWEHYVDRVAARCELEEAQRIAAQAIVRDLRARAVGADQTRINQLFRDLTERLVAVMNRKQLQLYENPPQAEATTSRASETAGK